MSQTTAEDICLWTWFKFKYMRHNPQTQPRPQIIKRSGCFEWVFRLNINNFHNWEVEPYFMFLYVLKCFLDHICLEPRSLFSGLQESLLEAKTFKVTLRELFMHHSTWTQRCVNPAAQSASKIMQPAPILAGAKGCAEFLSDFHEWTAGGAWSRLSKAH